VLGCSARDDDDDDNNNNNSLCVQAVKTFYYEMLFVSSLLRLFTCNKSIKDLLPIINCGHSKSTDSLMIIYFLQKVMYYMCHSIAL
jgi:hypothetical protein